MKALFVHAVIILAFMLLTGLDAPLAFGMGFVLGAALLSLIPGFSGSLRYGVRLYRIGKLFVVFLREFALSVFRVARLVLTPKMQFSPGIFHFPLRLTRDAEITLLANLITLTPGTLTVDVSADRRHLLVHAVDCPDPDAARADIANGFERLIREAFQP
jgi:multicomponent Na+:H+ antiporter subunit E